MTLSRDIADLAALRDHAKSDNDETGNESLDKSETSTNGETAQTAEDGNVNKHKTSHADSKSREKGKGSFSGSSSATDNSLKVRDTGKNTK